MYFYEIEVYYPFYESEKIIMGHDECFDDHQLNVIVQEAFDECIEEYCNKTLLDEGEEACRMKVGTIFKEYLPFHLKNCGFWGIKIDEICSIMNRELFVGKGARNNVLKNRYKDEGIDEHYTETLENNDELAIACAYAQLQLITEIIDEVERI